MEYKIEFLKSIKTLFMRNIGAYGSSDNFKMMEHFKNWMKDNNIENKPIYGIAWDNPENTLSDSCRYDLVIFSNNDNLNLTGPIKRGQFAGGKYAVFTIPHTTNDVQQFWNNMNIYIKNSELEIRNSPILERFNSEIVGSNFCDFLIPIR